MSTVSSLIPQSNSQGTSNAIDNQIAALEKRIADGVKKGSLTSQQGSDMTKILGEVQKMIDQSSADGGVSASDKRSIGIMLRELAKALTGAGAGANVQQPNVAADSDGDSDGSIGAGLLA